MNNSGLVFEYLFAREEVRQIFTIFTTYKSYPVLRYGKRYIRSSKFRRNLDFADIILNYGEEISDLELEFWITSFSIHLFFTVHLFYLIIRLLFSNLASYFNLITLFQLILSSRLYNMKLFVLVISFREPSRLLCNNFSTELSWFKEIYYPLRIWCTKFYISEWIIYSYVKENKFFLKSCAQIFQKLLNTKILKILSK